MPTRTLPLAVLSFAVAVAGLTPAGAVSAQVAQSASGTVDRTVQITEWTVPWEKSRPRDPYVAPDGRVWFVGQAGNYVAVLDPKSGEFKRDRKSTRLNSRHANISYAVFCLKKKIKTPLR